MSNVNNLTPYDLIMIFGLVIKHNENILSSGILVHQRYLDLESKIESILRQGFNDDKSL